MAQNRKFRNVLVEASMIYQKSIKLLGKLNNALKRSTVQTYNITFMKLRSVAMVHSHGNFHDRWRWSILMVIFTISETTCTVPIAPNVHSRRVWCKTKKEQQKEWLLRNRSMGQLSRNKLGATSLSLSSDETLTEVFTFRHRVQIPSPSSEGVPKSYHARLHDV
jgi:hypothetical protein